MILKVGDALKLLSRTDPESKACRDLGSYSPLLAAKYRQDNRWNSNSALLFCLPHKKVTKKVTATDKFAKTTPLRAKKLNIAIKQQ